MKQLWQIQQFEQNSKRGMTHWLTDWQSKAMIGLGSDKNPISHANGPLVIGNASVNENLSVSDFELMNKHITGLKVRLNSKAPFLFCAKSWFICKWKWKWGLSWFVSQTWKVICNSIFVGTELQRVALVKGKYHNHLIVVLTLNFLWKYICLSVKLSSQYRSRRRTMKVVLRAMSLT